MYIYLHSCYLIYFTVVVMSDVLYVSRAVVHLCNISDLLKFSPWWGVTSALGLNIVSEAAPQCQDKCLWKTLMAINTMGVYCSEWEDCVINDTNSQNASRCGLNDKASSKCQIAHDAHTNPYPNHSILTMRESQSEGLCASIIMYKNVERALRMCQVSFFFPSVDVTESFSQVV